MPAPVVDQMFGRVYSKAIQFYMNYATLGLLSNPSVPATDLAAFTSWSSQFVRVAGVKSISGPGLGRDVLELQELDVGPATANLGGAETAEMFYVKNKAPGDKDIAPVSLTLNMSHQQFEILYSAYIKDLVFGWEIIFPSGALMIGLGFVDSLEPSIESSKIVEVALDIQPSFGVDYTTNCTGYTALHNFWRNYLPNPGCAATVP